MTKELQASLASTLRASLVNFAYKQLLIMGWFAMRVDFFKYFADDRHMQYCVCMTAHTDRPIQ